MRQEVLKELELGISLPPGQLGLEKNSCSGSGKIVSLEKGLLKKNRMLGAYFKMAALPLSLVGSFGRRGGGGGGVLSSLCRKNLVS